ncbi:enoyl-CoA hydratase [Paracoccus sp. P2]|uniref:Enoyl-CoA hydratase domain-containing protein 3, mitochondrial n=1 Tax=Paracoccus pantotrophus TaxID=82367 RepID=Q9EYZ0_PARPN|nr:enoyl-CoA hydratase [Paracoccus pantotrophus]AAG29836.1 enoyl coenzyme A hydratase-like protein [Paracoccus pantotrophus]MDF3856094.1 enoyl-CoA hydratase [Paracoccus pantotrophus]QFG34776.1 enoyl-CoA hydratase [Paracoccus pantotrophus]QLH12958.1 enoyl-CoA hydratase [Paracoccus pantotrophus]RDD93376.1 enoyl-CoA hydratase [Paracoccus pantotrophus]
MKDGNPEPLVLRQDDGPVARLILNSPTNYNALSTAMIDALSDALDEIAADSRVRVLVLAARGKAFCAGHDLREMQGARNDEDDGRVAYERLFSRCAQMMQKLPALPQPVIAEVQGIATAAGCQLVASCDMAVAAEGVRFGVNGVNIGLFCSTPMVALTRAIPPRAAFELLVTGEFIDADRARELGLVNRVVPPAALEAEAMAMARTIAAKLPAAVRMGKRAFHAQRNLGLADAYETAGAVICENLLLPDTAEGIQAFLEKRPPNWE